MTEVTKISSKGQVVIPSDIREELGLDIGTTVAVENVNGMVLLRKINLPNLKKEFDALTKWGAEFAKKKGIKSEKDVERIIHQGRGVKSA